MALGKSALYGPVLDPSGFPDKVGLEIDDHFWDGGSTSALSETVDETRWHAIAVGGATAAISDAITDNGGLGVVTITTAADTVGCGLKLNGQPFFIDTALGFEAVFGARVAFDTATMTCFLGVSSIKDNANILQTDIIGGSAANTGNAFGWSIDVASTNFDMLTCDASTLTETASDTSLAADTWYNLSWWYKVRDASTREVKFFIDGAYKGTATANLPTSGFACQPYLICASSDSSADKMYIDRFYWKQSPYSS